MQSILNFFKSRYFWIGFGFALLIVLTLILGAWLGWSMVTRLLIVIGLLVVCIAIVVVEFVRASRSAQQIEQSIKMQAEQQRMSSRPDKQGEIEELQERLEEAIAKLKKSKLGRGRRGKNALHALPWYMFIGPPGAGKTTAIKNSGLNFPVGTDGVRGVGGTRNCDWFFTDQAILLDTAGRYMTEREDEEEWHAFLDMLKEHRSRRPVNGVIVGISIEELVDAAPDEIEWHANNIRRRISELVERLGVRFPVYLVFTKCDLLQGFVEFFGDMTRQEREQIWGCTLTEEQREEGNLRTVFEHEFDQLYDALVDARSERLSRSMKREERQRVYVFPLEFASAKENLSLFVDQLFQRNPYQENPEFRGFYFTSGTQEGAPIDRVIQSISQQFDFASGIDGGSEPDMEKKSYFIKDLFTDVVIPDQYMVEQTSSSARRGRLMRWGVGAAAAVLLGLFIVGLSQALVRSQIDLNQVENAAETAAVVEWDGQVTPDDLDNLDQLRTQIDELEQYEEDPPFMRWGLYRGGTVLEPARELYYRKMRPLVRDQFRALEGQISQQGGGDALADQGRRTLRDHLKAYLLLSEEAGRLSEERHRAFLTQHLAAMATNGNGPFATARFEGRGGQVEQQIATFVNGLGQQRVAPFEARSSLIERTRRLIHQRPTIENVYARIKQEGEDMLRPVRLTDIVQGNASLFAGEPQVSGFFTRDGWDTYVQERFKQEAKAPGEGDWVLGQQADEVSEELSDPEQVTEQLRERYFEEYAATWRRFLTQIEYRPLGDLRATSRVLNAQLGEQYDSPLLRVLARATRETQFGGSMIDEAQNRIGDEIKRRGQAKMNQKLKTRGSLQGGSDGESAMHPVDRRMAWLHQLRADEAESGNASTDLANALQGLRNVGTLLDGMINDRARATEVAAQVLSENGGDLGSALRTIRNQLSRFDPDARRQLFDAPILEAWEAILAAAQQHLNERWRAEVYRPYESNLDGRYPFSPSQQEAALNDVESFFHPQNGDVATFYRERLEPFLREDRSRARTWEGRGLQVAPATVRMLDDVDRIANGIFSGGGLQLTFQLQPEQPERSEGAPAASQVYIRIHGTAEAYNMGSYRPETRFAWPGERGATLSIQTSEGEMGPKQYDGAWAWFRLLDEAQVVPQGTNLYRVRWRFNQPERYSIVARYNLHAQQATELFTNPGSFFRLSVPETIN